VSRKPAFGNLGGAWNLILPALFAISHLSRGEAGTLTNEWLVMLPSASDSSPAVASDGTIYFGTFIGDLLALKPDGTHKWTFHAGREIKGAPAIGPDGTIYFGSRNRKLYAVQANGQQKWEFKTGAWVDASPAVGLDGTAYFGSWDKKFYAVSSEGAKRWEFPTAGEIVSSAAIGADGTIYFGSHDHKLYALAPDGKMVWEYVTGAPIISSPALEKDGSIYITSVDGFFYAMNPDGSLKWRLRTGGITESSPVIGEDGTIFVGVNEKLWAISPEGKKKSEQPRDLFITATPLALADNSVCFVARDGFLLDVLAPDKWKWSYRLDHGTVTPGLGSRNSIYAIGLIQNVGFALYSLPNTNSPAGSSWPKFRGNAQNTGRR
jgi:outer membrane protein assembly factor BamB